MLHNTPFGGLLSSVHAQVAEPVIAFRDIMPAQRKPEFGSVYAWDDSNYVPVGQMTGGNFTAADGGEDWWYAHTNLYENGVQIGYAVAGYNTTPEWGVIDLDGCFSAVDNGVESNQFETNEHRKGPLRQWLARYDLEGQQVWCKSFLMGTFYGVTQDPDGNIIAIGETWNNRNSTSASSGNPWPIRYNPGLPGNSGDISSVSCTSMGWLAMQRKASILKVDLAGEVNWQNHYAWPATLAEGWRVGTFGFDVKSTYSNGSIIYYASCSGGLDATSTEHAFLMRLQTNGEILDRHAYIATDPAIGLLGQTVVEQMRPVGLDLKEINGIKRLLVTGQFRINSTDPDINNAFVWYFDDLDNAPFAPTFGQITSSPELSPTHHDQGLLQMATSAALFDNSGTPAIIWPVLSNYVVGTDISGGRSIATLKVHRFDPPNATPTWTANLEEVRAYDLQAAAVQTSDGNIAVVSTKWDNAFSLSDPFRYDDLNTAVTDCLENYGGSSSWGNSDLFDYWNTDAFVAKLEPVLGNVLWSATFDADPNDPTCFPDDIRNQECMYKITEAEDGGLVISGNTSHNFDDAYLAKVLPTCQSFLSFTPLDLNEDGEYLLASNETWSTDRTIYGTVALPEKRSRSITTLSSALPIASNSIGPRALK